jgi:hypothetical protein
VVGVVLLGLALLGLAMAVAGMLAPLPTPAAGGTCGPGRGSESAAEAFFNPGSIGAGGVPSTAAGYYQRLAFIGECQSSTDARMLQTGAVLVLSLVLLVIGLLLLRSPGRPAARRPAGANLAVTPAGAGWTAAPPVEPVPTEGAAPLAFEEPAPAALAEPGSSSEDGSEGAGFTYGPDPSAWSPPRSDPG